MHDRAEWGKGKKREGRIIEEAEEEKTRNMNTDQQGMEIGS